MQADTSSNIDFTSYLNAHESKDMLRFITCGSVDDGKSTLIGRMLFESKLICEDHLEALSADSKKYGTTGDELDLALLVDGLASEREQGITIDVAYRFFSTVKRKFIVADTPGHEQYTRNMATGASTADLAIVIVDARKGLLTQTCRHSFIVSMLGVNNIILAVNKMDLVDYEQSIFDEIKSNFIKFSKRLGKIVIHAIPVSALKGDNITSISEKTPWYKGSSLITHLEEIELTSDRIATPFCMGIQWVNRPNLDFRGFSGRIISGKINSGDYVKILPSGKESKVERIVTFDGDLNEALEGQSVTLILCDDLDVSRGDVFSSMDSPCQLGDQFEANLLWMSDKPMVSGRQYLLKTGVTTSICTPSKIKYCIDVNTLEHKVSKALNQNDIGCCELALDRMIPFQPYATNRDLGGFILIDRLNNETVAAGFLHFALRRSSSVLSHATIVDQAMRSAIKKQNPMIFWLTGLSGSGKSTIGNLVEHELNLLGMHTMLLDGDNMRQGLNRNLGFTEADRAENIRRTAEVAKLMVEAGLITIVAVISPFQAEREMARSLVGKNNFCEIYIDSPLEIAESRDIKGLYKRARAGEITNFTGVGSRYEAPEAPDLRIDTAVLSPNDAKDRLLSFIKEKFNNNVA